MDYKKSINSFEMKKRIGRLIIEQFFFYQFVNNFSSLLCCKINVLHFFDMGDFCQIFVKLQVTEILIESNYCLGMYVQ